MIKSRTRKHCRSIPVKFLATTPGGDRIVDSEAEARPLPSGPVGTASAAGLTYGPYLEAVQRLLLEDSCRQLTSAIGARLGRSVHPGDIEEMEIRTEKHGAFYHVARVRVRLPESILDFAVNVAATEEANSTLQREFFLLQKLQRQYPGSCLPQVYFKGRALYHAAGSDRRLHLFVGEWLGDYHEFHLHRGSGDDLHLLLWDAAAGHRCLSRRQAAAIHRQAARILARYYNWNTFRHIHPWHHAAGDFVAREREGKLDVRLITVRDYAPAVSFRTSKRAGRLLALVLFFLHLTVQMRLDRVDGVGEVVWDPACCLDSVGAGFFEGIEATAAKGNKGMPAPSDLLDIFRRFAKAEWFELLAEAVETYRFAGEEVALILKNADPHLEQVQEALGKLGDGKANF